MKDLKQFIKTTIREFLNESKNEHTFGKISFEDENDVVRVIDFTITGSSVVV